MSALHIGYFRALAQIRPAVPSGTCEGPNASEKLRFPHPGHGPGHRRDGRGPAGVRGNPLNSRRLHRSSARGRPGRRGPETLDARRLSTSSVSTPPTTAGWRSNALEVPMEVCRGRSIHEPDSGRADRVSAARTSVTPYPMGSILSPRLGQELPDRRFRPERLQQLDIGTPGQVAKLPRPGRGPRARTRRTPRASSALGGPQVGAGWRAHGRPGGSSRVGRAALERARLSIDGRDQQHGLPHALFVVNFAGRHREAERGAVEVDLLLQVMARDPDMIDLGQHGPPSPLAFRPLPLPLAFRPLPLPYGLCLWPYGLCRYGRSRIGSRRRSARALRVHFLL